MNKTNNCAHDWDEPAYPVLGSERTCERCGEVEIMEPEDTLLGNDGPVWRTLKRGGDP